MKFRATFLVLSLAAISQAGAQAEVIGRQAAAVPGYKSDDFVREALGTPHVSKSDMDAPTLFAMRYADGYIAGVVDATEGGTWCSPHRLKEHELDERVWVAMKERKGTMTGNAAMAMLEQLNAKYPCGKTRTVIAPRFRPTDFVAGFLAVRRLNGEKNILTTYQQRYLYGDPEAIAIHKERYATGYRDGVVEATQGRSWCAPASMTPSELTVEPVAAMEKKRSWPRLANAAKELLVQIDEKFPCTERKTR